MSAGQATGSTRIAFSAVWSHKLLWLLQLVANAALLAAAYAWLWIPDEKVWEIGVSGVLGLALLLAAVWLQWATLVYYRDAYASRDARIGPAFRSARERFRALIFWLVLVTAIFLLLDVVQEKLWIAATWSASWLTMALRRPIHPPSILRLFSWLLWLVRWGLVPLAFLPLAFQAVTHGPRAYAPGGIARAWRIFWRRKYWLAYAALFLLGGCGAYWLVHWVPKVSTIRWEATSLGVRFIIAYLLGLTGWVVLLSLIACLGCEDGGEAPGVRETVAVGPTPRTGREAVSPEE